MNAASVVLTMQGGGDIQTILAGNKIIELYALSVGGDTKNFAIFSFSWDL